MKQNRSLFRRFLKVHFLFIFLPPILLIFISAFFGVSDIHENNVNTLHLFYVTVLLFVFIIVAFVALSWLFFLKLQKRLASLQEVMSSSAITNSFPKPISVQADRMDEIDQLGSSFNWMIQQLKESRKQAYEEELLRHRLIANLSHDLRTPLTIMRGHVTRLNKEPISLEGQHSLTEINHTITRVGDLMDDLLSYTLLTSGKQPFEPVSTDIGRLVRAAVAAWYPVFEEHGIQLDVDLPADETFYWEADPKWMTRVLDNLFQNIVRHAAEGKYAHIAVDVKRELIIVADRGPGLDKSSHGGGAGIGLSTCDYMLNKMNLKADFTSNEDGTNVAISRA
ncbi:HAMP domain-containing histidine kinase [Paenibacillus sp. Marseille-P2973]|uniref:HAMP domain-containing sensor histidine kinase n=1 Tax=Paenibacillus sp. Marseille-P2973 TaxID=1871032 RepID=UPI001B396CF0|nr:HAMP domain-containing sensor histidine kinase [Paenibacillus sp. Marseille-P2973]MBQ4898063.1 HAMP domain-containing histidine kinase [Paenibacillus sp. Marseille-P2973]